MNTSAMAWLFLFVCYWAVASLDSANGVNQLRHFLFSRPASIKFK